MTELLYWWNLIFVLPFVAALFYILLLTTGTGAAHHGHGTDVDHAVDHDVGIEHDVADTGHDFGHGVEHGCEAGTFLRGLSFLGIGRVPVSIIVVSFCFIWGFSGWASNRMLDEILPATLFFWPSLVIALRASVFVTRILATGISKIMPATETYAVSEGQLTGRIAEAVTNIDDSFGQAQVHDDSGFLHTISSRVKPGEKKIPRGTQVVLMYHNQEERFFFVNSELPSTEGLTEE